MAHQIAQECALWYSVTLGYVDARKVKSNWANIANGSSTIDLEALENA